MDDDFKRCRMAADESASEISRLLLELGEQQNVFDVAVAENVFDTPAHTGDSPGEQQWETQHSQAAMVEVQQQAAVVGEPNIFDLADAQVHRVVASSEKEKATRKEQATEREEISPNAEISAELSSDECGDGVRDAVVANSANSEAMNIFDIAEGT